MTYTLAICWLVRAYLFRNAYIFLCKNGDGNYLFAYLSIVMKFCFHGMTLYPLYVLSPAGNVGGMVVFVAARRMYGNLLRFIAIDIVQTMMSVSTLYLFPFSSYIQKTKHVFGSHSTVPPKKPVSLEEAFFYV